MAQCWLAQLTHNQEVAGSSPARPTRKKKQQMIIKNKKHRGKRTERTCLNCGEKFLELDIKIRQGFGKFCSNKCYIAPIK